MTLEQLTAGGDRYTEQGLHVVSRRVSWAECDPAGIGYTPRFVEWFIEAIEGFFADVLHYPWQDLHASGIGAPFVNVQLEFHSSVRVGDQLDLTLSVRKIGGSSIVWGLTGHVQGRHCFSGTAVTVFVDTASNKPTRIPELIQRRLRLPA